MSPPLEGIVCCAALTSVAWVYKRGLISENDRKRKTHPRMISIASTLIHPGRVSASPLTNLISRVRTTSGFYHEFGGEEKDDGREGSLRSSGEVALQ